MAQEKRKEILMVMNKIESKCVQVYIEYQIFDAVSNDIEGLHFNHNSAASKNY